MLPGWIAWRIISLGAQKHNKYNLHVFILYIDVIISYSFKRARSPGEKQAEKRGVMGTAIFFITAPVWSTAHAYYVWPWRWRNKILLINYVYYIILSKFPQLKISLTLLFQTSKDHIKYTQLQQIYLEGIFLNHICRQTKHCGFSACDLHLVGFHLVGDQLRLFITHSPC